MNATRGSMHHGAIRYGDTHIGTMTGDEAGYATEAGQVMLTSVTLPEEALAILASGRGVRILADGGCEPLESETRTICFGRFKGDRPRLGL